MWNFVRENISTIITYSVAYFFGKWVQRQQTKAAADRELPFRWVCPLCESKNKGAKRRLYLFKASSNTIDSLERVIAAHKFKVHGIEP